MKKLISSIMLLCVLLSLFSVIVHSEKLPDFAKDISLTVNFRSGSNHIGGGEISLYQVAQAHIENDTVVYSFTENFENSNIDITKDAKELIDELGAYITLNAIGCVTEPIGENGKAVFEELKPGFYFAVQNKAGEGYLPAAPFIIELPTVDEKGVYSFDAVVNAKVSPKSDDTTIPETTKPSGDKLPQTGQLKWPIPILTAVGLAFFIVGWILFFSNKKCKNEN